jgi:hypothetical protein
MRFEYAWVASPGEYAPYETATSIAGAQAAASTTPKTGGLPAISSLAAVASGGNVTITLTVAHPYGIYGVRIHDAAGSVLDVATMTWNTNGGAITTNFNSQSQSCTATVPGSVGTWFYVEAISIDDDVRYQTVVATA